MPRHDALLQSHSWGRSGPLLLPLVTPIPKATLGEYYAQLVSKEDKQIVMRSIWLVTLMTAGHHV